MASLPRHKQLEAERIQNTRQPMKIKKKKTSGYAIFCSEYRRKYATEEPAMQFTDISKQVAEDWRTCDESVKRTYEDKAQRFNVEEERRWRQKVQAHQQSQMRMAQQNRMKQQQGQGAYMRQPMGRGSRGGAVYARGRGRGSYAPRGGGGQAASGLVISNVSNLLFTRHHNIHGSSVSKRATS